VPERPLAQASSEAHDAIFAATSQMWPSGSMNAVPGRYSEARTDRHRRDDQPRPPKDERDGESSNQPHGERSKHSIMESTWKAPLGQRPLARGCALIVN
jgi:hypothetical protein